VSAEKSEFDARPILDEMLAAAREGLERSKWKIGDSYEKLLMPIIGELTVYFGRKLRLDMPPSEKEVRETVASELREAASRHPAGGARRASLMEAAEMVERKNR
jgi:hypothetical protein